MKIHYLQHVPFEDLANILPWCNKREHKVTCTKLYNNESLPARDKFDWLIIMGGPMNIYEEIKYPWLIQEKHFIEEAIRDNKIVLGICLGAQIIADVLGGTISKNKHKEIGWFPVSLDKSITGQEKAFLLPERFMTFHWHGDTFDIPQGCLRLAESEACENQAFEYNGYVLGLQFHLESSVESVKKLITNCSDELIEGKYIQNSERILSNEKYFKDNNKMMSLVLEKLEGKYHSTTANAK